MQVDWGYGVLVSVIRQQAVTVADVGTYLVDVLLAVDQKSLSGPSACPLPAKMGEQFSHQKFVVFRCHLTL